MLAAKQWLTFTSGSPLQPAVAHALDHEPDFPAELAASLQTRRDLLVDGLASAGLTARVPEGTYFATTDISHLGWEDGLSFCLALPERAGVVAIPNQVFYDDQDAGRHLVRWAFCKEPDLITEGVRRLAAADLTADQRGVRSRQPRVDLGSPQAADGRDGGDRREQRHRRGQGREQAEEGAHRGRDHQPACGPRHGVRPSGGRARWRARTTPGRARRRRTTW